VLTTMHRPDKIENTKKRDRDGNQIQKNKIIVDYNAFMGGVDKNVYANRINGRRKLQSTT